MRMFEEMQVGDGQLLSRVHRLLIPHTSHKYVREVIQSSSLKPTTTAGLLRKEPFTFFEFLLRSNRHYMSRAVMGFVRLRNRKMAYLCFRMRIITVCL